MLSFVQKMDDMVRYCPKVQKSSYIVSGYPPAPEKLSADGGQKNHPKDPV